ncbi:MAG: CoA pyrophosphatase [Rhodospirillales bacterium]|jgi:8-oxo-dGTP pyrophosphatase MutT (NUDIX family)|nr:CoA pyrophosphatase [Rhodospirillales bacterium]
MTRRIARRTSRNAGAGPGRSRLRGDHQLNPGLTPRRELRPAAVLVPIVDRHSGPSVLFTRRTDHLAHHAGQISFPGGGIEPGDGDAESAALREAAEEVGLERDRVRVIGQLDEYATRTGFLVTPVVALVDVPFAIELDAGEVAAVFEVPLAFLLEAGNYHRHSRTFDGIERFFHAVQYAEHYIWGATAGILIDLRDTLTVT